MGPSGDKSAIDPFCSANALDTANSKSAGNPSPRHPAINAATEAGWPSHTNTGTRHDGGTNGAARRERSSSVRTASISSSFNNKSAAPMRKRSICRAPNRSHGGAHVTTTSTFRASNLSTAWDSCCARDVSSCGSASMTMSLASGSTERQASANSPLSRSRMKHGLWALNQNTCVHSNIVSA